MMTAPTSSSGLLDIGRVESVANEICIVSGLSTVALNYVVEFSSGLKGLVLGYTQNEVQVIILGNYHNVTKGELVRVADKGLMTNTSEKLLGRVINPLGQPLDELGSVEEGELRYIESPAKSVNDRAFVDRPLYTGFLVVDSQVPIGLGQRELLVGGKKVGMIDVAIEAIVNQARIKSGLLCVYVALDAETTATKRKVQRLSQAGALSQCVVIVTRSSDPASLNYIAPMVGVTIAEAFASRGRDVLVVLDNLTSHAKVYRQISLLLNRPAGREAYPGDIFYLHARLLERCGAFDARVGGGSITALPIVETQSDEVTDYITTNLMSITDGHILFRQSLANKGIQPAIDSGFSVSRIGGRAQTPIMRRLSDELKQSMIQYSEMERYLSFGADLQDSAKEAVALGKRILQFLNQEFESGLSPELEVALLYLIATKRALEWEELQMSFLRSQLVQFLLQPSRHQQLLDACSKATYEEAEPILHGLIQSFVDDPASIRPITKTEAPEAEKETIIDLLREGSGAANDS